jgi:hypothetical protein
MMGVKSFLVSKEISFRRYWAATGPVNRDPMAYPSGSWSFRMDIITTDPPPGLLLTKIGCPRILLAVGDRARQTTSDPPPGANPTSKLIGFEGYFSWANKRLGAGVRKKIRPSTQVKNKFPFALIVLSRWNKT